MIYKKTSSTVPLTIAKNPSTGVIKNQRKSQKENNLVNENTFKKEQIPTRNKAFKKENKLSKEETNKSTEKQINNNTTEIRKGLPKAKDLTTKNTVLTINNMLEKKEYLENTHFVKTFITFAEKENYHLDNLQMSFLKKISRDLINYKENDLMKQLFSDLSQTLQEMSLILKTPMSTLFKDLFTAFQESLKTKEKKSQDIIENFTLTTLKKIVRQEKPSIYTLDNHVSALLFEDTVSGLRGELVNYYISIFKNGKNS